MHQTRTVTIMLACLSGLAGYLASNLLDDTKAELQAQRTTNSAQNERLARLEEQMTYLRADLLEIKQGQQLILKAVAR